MVEAEVAGDLGHGHAGGVHDAHGWELLTAARHAFCCAAKRCETYVEFATKLRLAIGSPSLAFT